MLAWRQRNKGYALIVLTYLLQWLPWMRSPRITFAYHFYVDIPLICLCNAIVLQRVWKWASQRDDDGGKWLGGIAVGAYVLAVVGAFVFFYPILAAYPITWDAWHAADVDRQMDPGPRIAKRQHQRIEHVGTFQVA